jgi:hypothetical protein
LKMRKQITIAAILAVVVLGASAQTRMEATGPFTYEALGATPTLKVRGTSPAATVARTQRPAPTGSSEARSNPFNYEAVGATPHIEMKRPPARATTQLQPTAR